MNAPNETGDTTGANAEPDGSEYVFPASRAQQGLWILDQLEPNSALYNMPVAFRLNGVLDVNAFVRAYHALLERHEALRTVFGVEGGQPMQVVHSTPHPGARMRVVDLSHEAHDAAERHALRSAQDEIETPFDLARGPLIRALVIRRTDEDHVLVITLHHIVADGLSIDVLLGELGRLYGATANDASSALPPLELQYADYAIWEREWLQDAGFARQLDYWRDRLRAPVAQLALPTDHPRPATQTFRGAVHSIQFAQSTARAIREFCRREKATLFATALASFGVLLHRHTGQTDILVGTPVAGRTRPGLDHVVGLLLKTIVMRMQIDPDVSFASHLRSVRDLVVDGLANQEVPFEKLVEELVPARDAGRSPLFQAMLVVQHSDSASLTLPGVTATALDGLSRQTAKFDLTLILVETDGGIEARFQYNTDLFAADTIARMAEHYRTLLEGAVSAPDTAIGALPLLTAAEEQWLVHTLNATDTPFPAECTLHELVERQTDRTPDTLAVVLEDQTLTYRELDARANQLAAALRAHAVGPDVLVGVCMERSIELVVALLAVLKAGGAYVPLDPDYPQERLSYVLRDTQAQVVLCQARFVEHLAGYDGHLLAVDANAAEVAAQSTVRTAALAGPGDLAYVIYTSGSTGRPKGAMISHRAIVNQLWWRQDSAVLTGTDRVLLKTPFTFDPSVSEFFWPLIAGACIVLALPGGHRDPAYLTALIRRAGVTAIAFVPTLLRAFLGDENASRCSSLRWVMCGGEALTRELQDLCLARLPAAKFVHAYGPTEASIVATSWKCRPDDARAHVPIGRPISNMQCYVLDVRRQPVPVGVIGELYLGGVGVGRGYHNQPKLTAERFVADPFRPAPGARLYRTGDFVRVARGGELEFVGRMDFQVKLRGFRIELGEIETVIARCPGVLGCAVTMREAAPGDERLVAYVAGTGVREALREAVTAGIAKALPEHMRPSTFVFLDEIPLTTTGKVDRNALPAPNFSVGSATHRTEPLETDTERSLAAIWREVLGSAEIGRRDNFFALGGHSLLATQVVARISSTFHCDIALRSLFESPELAALASRIDEAAIVVPSRARSTITRMEFDGPSPLSFSQERMWILHELNPEGAAYNIPSAVWLRGPLNRDALDRAIDLLVSRHEVLRTTYSLASGGPVQEVRDHIAVPSFFRDFRNLGDAAAGQALQVATTAGRTAFDLARGPVFRSMLLQVADEEHLLVISMHHIVTDQWSNGVMRRELSAAYSAYRAGSEPQLPALPIRYRDFAVWQRTSFAGEILDRQLAYWRTQLAGVAALELPADFARPAFATGRGAFHTDSLPADLLDALEDYSRTHGCTLFMTLLAAFIALLHRYGGQDDIAVAIPIANREQEAVELLVGPLVNTLIVRVACPGHISFDALLHRVREAALDAYANQEFPFERLVEELRPARDPSRAPLAQVLFAMRDVTGDAVQFDGLSSERAMIDTGTSQFDLGVSVDTRFGKSVGVEYNTDLFEAETIARLASHYRTLLEGIAADSARSLGALPMLTPAEEESVLRTFNTTDAPFPADTGLARLIEAQVAQTPRRVAVTCDGEALTYDELNAHANAVARHLRSLGVGPGVQVALCVHRGLHVPVALLAILKAGGAYVPMDPAFPAERLEFMLTDSGAAVLVTADGAAAGITVPPSVRLFDLDAGPDLLDNFDAANLEGGAGPDDIAYVLYTSGSTGRPKGVAVQHRALVNFLWSMTREPGVSATDVLAAVTTISFDIAGLELYLPLLAGARIELVGREDAASGTALSELLTRSGATLMQATPATWRMLIETGWRPQSRFRALCGGEALPRELANTLLDRVDELWNLYGPTETTIWSTAERVHAGDGAISIGRPIANTRVYVLDKAGNPMPVGAPGEIVIGGVGVAVGYHGRNELTAERFAIDPFDGRPNTRLYHTGDVGRWRADGRLEHIGRLDNQVKVRGFRIELGEIEKALSTHPAVAQTTVTTYQAGLGDLRLVAYVQYRAADDLTTSDVRRYLRRVLPEYMIPSMVVPVDCMPLTPNGKIDRAALPDPFRGTLQSTAIHADPAPGAEAVLAGIWRDILNLERVGAEDNFFELGGHSLLSLRVAAAAKDRLGWRMDPRLLFFQTLRQIAAGMSPPASENPAARNG